jgi:hypothetical protein
MQVYFNVINSRVTTNTHTITVIEFYFQVSVAIDMDLTSLYSFNIGHPHWYVHAKVYFTLINSKVTTNKYNTTHKGGIFLLPNLWSLIS